MLKIRFAIIVFIAGSIGDAAAQSLTPEQIDACKPDFDKYCGGKVPGPGQRVVGCIVTGSFSDACKKAMDESERSRRKPQTKN